MSLFEQFSYKGRGMMVFNGRAGKNTKSASYGAIHDVTPNKAHSYVTSIPETPNSLLPTPPSRKPSQKRQQRRQRRRARISSSSEEDKTEVVPSTTAPGKGSLFSELPVTKRRKKDLDNIQAVAVRAEECESGLQRRSKPPLNQCILHSNPKRLFHGRREDKENEQGLSPSYNHGDSDSEPEPVTATARGKQGKGRQGRRRVIELSSDSEEEGLKAGSCDGKESSSSSCDNGGWLTTRVRAKLQKFSFKKKTEKGQQIGSANGICEDRCISISSDSSSSSSSVIEKGDSSSQSSQGGSSLQAVSQDTDSTDSSCIIVDSPVAESAVSTLKRPAAKVEGRGGDTTGPASRSNTAKFYGRGTLDSECKVSPCKEEFRDSEEQERDLSSSEESDSNSSEDSTDSRKESILDFLNGHDEEELCDIPGCSLSKAKLLTQLRPFQDWSQLVETLSLRKNLGEKIIEGCLCLLEERRVIASLLSKCQAISATLQDCLSKLTVSPTDTGENGNPGVHCSSQPRILNTSVQLKPYQLVGLNWLAMLHSHDLNGILADEMGLGKTVQAIAFLAHLFQRRFSGIYLVIAPTSTIDNWAREFEKWCPELIVQVYHGPMTQRSSYRDAILCGERCDVLLSTYQVCVGQWEDRRFLRKLPIGCVVFDEAHMLKNMTTQRYAHLMKIKAKRRLLLTGTPLQNNLLELISLLSFVMPEIFSEFSLLLKKVFSRKIDESSSYYRNQVKQAKQIMQPFILRRLKSQVLKQLPAKVESTEWCRMTESQCRLYSLAVERSQKDLPNWIGPSGDLSNSMSAIMELRKIALHPLLVRQRYNNTCLGLMSREILRDPAHRDADPALVYEDMSVMSDFELHNLCMETKVLSKYALSRECLEDSAKFKFLKSKLQELKDQGSRVLLFSQFTMMLDVLEVFLQFCGHTHLRLDGSTMLTDRQKLIDQYNNDQGIFIFLLSTKAGGLGVNLTSANVVILYDIDFNPYNDKQAQDRCHRVGQTREVTVIRLICKGTIEETILQCAETKLKLEQDLSHVNAEGPSNADVATLLEHGLGLKK